MKKLLLFLLFLSGIANAQIVNIPDANFKAKLLTSLPSNMVACNLNMTSFKIDSNSDNEIQVSEALQVGYIDVSNSNILNMTGVEQFVNLKTIICNNNQISNLNVSIFPNLFKIVCNNNQLTSLDLTGLANLQILNCKNNLITTLNASGFTSLTVLECSYNPITNLNVSGSINLANLFCQGSQLTSLNLLGLAKLTYVYCGGNQISTLNLSGQPILQELYCNSNQLTALDLSGNLLLQQLVCHNNQITSLNLLQLVKLNKVQCNSNLLTTLDVSQNVLLSYLNCNSNQLTYLNMKNGANEMFTFVSGNPNLQYICADEVQVSNIQTLAGASVMVSSYCNFTSGGNYNTVSGTVNYDYNNDGCGAGDNIFPNGLTINLTNGTVSSGTFPSTNGNYSLFTTTGSHTLTTSVENPSYFTITPNSVAINLPLLNNSTTTQNFCITPNGIHPDLEVVIVPILPARPGFDAVYKIVYKNKGNQTLSGNVNFQYNDTNLDFVSSTTTPSSQTTGSLVWNYVNLMPFESRSVNVTLNVNSPTETPAVNIDDILNFTAIANPISGDETTSDNTFQYNQTVVGAFDPNDKTCLEGNLVSPTKIGEYLHYNINFENTGTFQATNIVVKDVIDVAKFDVNTIQILDASHPVIIRTSGSKVEFIFENINLGASQKGNTVFKIKTKSNLVTGDLVSNKANIYFDYNFPIETNTATTTFQVLSNDDFVLDNSVSVFPNPTKDKINVTATSNIKSIQVYDVQGRLLETGLDNDTSANVDLSRYNHGIYLLKIITDNGASFQKVIKE